IAVPDACADEAIYPSGLRCAGLREAYPFCQVIARHLHSGKALTSGDQMFHWIQHPAVRVQARALSRTVARVPPRARDGIALLADRAYALLAAGRFAEALAQFLTVAEQAPTWNAPADGARLSFAMLWPQLTGDQRHDGAIALTIALGEQR
ncbi:MAG: hypothetical protein HYV03_02395, partial [Deltaproteobacteria bacterium]|nr:hypothetical protein [Deltaproteobacteria bacterium]